uniref:F-box domain-containing protein n=1 Tax=Tetradesmus obliquus TaxID=3088 RepID=A0A383V515_TETOB|eukprot:jgi/Sobl393_1/7708/SZX59476.1
MSTSRTAAKRGRNRQAPEVRAVEEAATSEVPLALSIALEHPTLSNSPQVLCAAARSCEAWRQAVQRCAVCNTEVVLEPERLLQRLGSFAQWLPKHAALVEAISVMAEQADWGGGQALAPHHEAAQQLLQRALQAAAGRADAGAAAALPAGSNAGATSSTQQQQQQQQQLPQLNWRLTSFTSNLPEAPALLCVLPACSLTHLHLELQSCGAAARASAELSQLVRLRGLRELHLRGQHYASLPEGFCLSSIGQLSQLTALDLMGSWSGISKQLPALLGQALPLRALQVQVRDIDDIAIVLPSLAHLTQLTMLISRSPLPSAAGASVLPAQLQALCLVKCKDLAPVLALSQLQRLTLCPDFAERQRVLELVQLPALQELHLDYRFAGLATVTAGYARMWAQLPQLRGLSLDEGKGPSSAAILAGAAAATQLTNLDLKLTAYPTPVLQSDFMPLCGSLTALGGLEALSLDANWLVPGDALALTALTGLTRLVLTDLRAAVGKSAATALARSLKQLELLHLEKCSANLGSAAFLAAVGQLKKLSYLGLKGNGGLTQQGLMQLTGLSRLQQLEVDKGEKPTDKDLGRFWAAVRRQ